MDLLQQWHELELLELVLILNYILFSHVPNLSCNLLSISKLTRDLKCRAHFFESSCVFQNLTLGKKIGNARELWRGYAILRRKL